MSDTFANATLAWLITYAMHSTVLLGGAWLFTRSRRAVPAVADVVWKTALVGAILSATTQVVFDRRPAGSMALATTERPVGVGAESDGVVPVSPSAAIEHEVLESSSSALNVPAFNPERTSTLGREQVFGWLTLAWLAMAFVALAWYTGRRLILVGRLGDRRTIVDGPLPTTLAELRLATGATVPLRLTASATISSPVALHGEICLPEVALVELDAAQQRAMLAHELAHIERRDPEWLVLTCVVERLFFFQPLNRLARIGIQDSAELLADDWAVRQSGGVPLAKALVKVAEWMQASPLGVPVAGFAEERSQLTRRVTRLLETEPGVQSSRRVRAAATMAAVLLLCVTAAFAPGVQAIGPTESRMPESRLQELRALESSSAEPPTLGRGDEAPRIDTAIVRAVIARLSDENAEVRQAAANALGRMGHPMAIEPLVQALDDADREVKRAALFALGNFERAPVPVAPIRKVLLSDDADSRAHAVRMLGELRDRASIPAISRLVLDASADVRQSALHTLNELEALIADELLATALADRSADVRLAAVHFAGERQILSAVPALARMLDDRSSEVREMAAHGLTEMRTETAHNALRRALTHKDPNVRRVAVEYFGELVDK